MNESLLANEHAKEEIELKPVPSSTSLGAALQENSDIISQASSSLPTSTTTHPQNSSYTAPSYDASFFSKGAPKQAIVISDYMSSADDNSSPSNSAPSEKKKLRLGYARITTELASTSYFAFGMFSLLLLLFCIYGLIYNISIAASAQGRLFTTNPFLPFWGIFGLGLLSYITFSDTLFHFIIQIIEQNLHFKFNVIVISISLATETVLYLLNALIALIGTLCYFISVVDAWTGVLYLIFACFCGFAILCSFMNKANWILEERRRQREREQMLIEKPTQFYDVQGEQSRFILGIVAIIIYLIRTVLLVLSLLAIAFFCSVTTFGNGFQRAGARIQYGGAAGEMNTIYDQASLHLRCQGTVRNNLTIVLETGLEPAALQWKFVANDLASITRTCWYDRAGYGFSSSGEFPRIASTEARELRELLLASRELQPNSKLILVGQNYGTHIVRMFQNKYPEIVAGMMFVDPWSANNTVLQAVVQKSTPDAVQSALTLSLSGDYMLTMLEIFGLTRVAMPQLATYSSLYAQQPCQNAFCYDGALAAAVYNNRFLLARYSELTNLYNTELEVSTIGTEPYILKNLPLTVLSAAATVSGTCELANVDLLLRSGIITDRNAYCDKVQKELAIWNPINMEEHRKMSQFSTNSVWKIYSQSRAVISLDKPEELKQDITLLFQRVLATM